MQKSVDAYFVLFSFKKNCVHRYFRIVIYNLNYQYKHKYICIFYKKYIVASIELKYIHTYIHICRNYLKVKRPCKRIHSCILVKLTHASTEYVYPVIKTLLQVSVATCIIQKDCIAR